MPRAKLTVAGDPIPCPLCGVPERMFWIDGTLHCGACQYDVPLDKFTLWCKVHEIEEEKRRDRNTGDGIHR